MKLKKSWCRVFSAFLLLAMLLTASACVTTKPETDTGHATDGTTDEQTEPVTEPETEPAPVDDGTVNPVFSAEGGYYTETVVLTLTLPERAEKGTYITYTLDGSEPTRRDDKASGEIALLDDSRKSVTVRAVCYGADGTPVGHIVTKTYILRASLPGLYTVCVSTDESNLTGSNGIFTHYSEKLEVPASIEIITPAGERVIAQDGGVRVFGGSSRSLSQKSLKIIARKPDYFDNAGIKYTGTGKFRYALFSDRMGAAGKNAGQVLDRYDSFVLRNGGNDSLQATAADGKLATMLRDGVANNFAAVVAPALQYQFSQFAVVYLNGEFYGLLDMKENLNEDYAANIYGLDDKQVCVIKSELDTTRHCPAHSNGSACRFDNVWFFYETDKEWNGELTAFKALCKKAIAAKESNYDEIFAEVSSKIDLENLMQYYALNLYLCNTDWPHNNVKLWRYTGAAVDGVSVSDGKWRFMTRDMDMVMGRYSCLVLPEIYTQADTDTFTRTLANYWSGVSTDGIYPDSLYLQGLLDFCLKNDDFRASFTAYCRSLVSEENAAALSEIVKKSANSISALLPEHLSRWQGTYASGYTTRVWKNDVAAMQSFITARKASFLRYLDAAMAHYN